MGRHGPTNPSQGGASPLLDPQGADKIKAAAQADQGAPRGEFLFRPPAAVDRALRRLLQDPRDLPLAYLLLNICCTTLPAAALLFTARPASNLPGLAYLVANYVLYLQRFMLMLHFSEHRRLFRKGCGALNKVVPLLLCPLFGVPSGMYWLHHCAMHHTEDNRRGWDLSSTEPFQRDNPLHFLWYWFRYWVLAWVELPLYALRRGRWAALAACLATEAAYLGGVQVLWVANPMATKWVFVIPFFISSFALMFGNWSQHIFIDPTHPASDYSLAYNCVACPDNQRTFNDGYHVVHHLNSQLHWSELPGRFCETLDKHAEQDALVFHGIGFFDVGAAVFGRRYAFLASHLARYSARFAALGDGEVEALLRARLAPVVRRGG